MTYSHDQTEHNRLLEDYLQLLIEAAKKGPILDVAGGDCRNSVYIAKRNLDAVCCDISEEALGKGKAMAERENVTVRLWRVDLEQDGVNPLPETTYGGIMVFRYLNRPLIPCIRKALMPGGVILYETFTAEQARFGKPSNPDFLLKPGELKRFFDDWDILYYFEGLLDDPPRAVAQLVGRKNV